MHKDGHYLRTTAQPDTLRVNWRLPQILPAWRFSAYSRNPVDGTFVMSFVASAVPCSIGLTPAIRKSSQSDVDPIKNAVVPFFTKLKRHLTAASFWA